jgi:ligand-binding sensor domain-containing protein
VGTGLGAVIVESTRLRPIDLRAHEDAEYAFGFLEDRQRGAMWIASDRGLLRFDADGRPTGRSASPRACPTKRCSACCSIRKTSSGPAAIAASFASTWVA